MKRKILVSVLSLVAALTFSACNGTKEKVFSDNGGSGITFTTSSATVDLSAPADLEISVTVGGRITGVFISASKINNYHIDYNHSAGVMTVKKDAFAGLKRAERTLKIENSLGESGQIPLILVTKIIRTADDFVSIGQDADSLKGSYIQAADIDFNGIDNPSVGSEIYPFGGTYDGAGYKLINAKLDHDLGQGEPQSYVAGLFRYTDASAIIKRVTALNVSVISWGIGGGLAGKNSGVIENCFVEGDVAAAVGAGNEPSGGFVGFNDGEIKNCISVTRVDGLAFCGGNFSAQLENCYAAVKDESYLATIGGFVHVNSEPSPYEKGFEVTNRFAVNMFNGFFSDENCGIKTDDELKTASLYAEFDSAVWLIEDGKYPTVKK